MIQSACCCEIQNLQAFSFWFGEYSISVNNPVTIPISHTENLDTVHESRGTSEDLKCVYLTVDKYTFCGYIFLIKS